MLEYRWVPTLVSRPGRSPVRRPTPDTRDPWLPLCVERDARFGGPGSGRCAVVELPLVPRPPVQTVEHRRRLPRDTPPQSSSHPSTRAHTFDRRACLRVPSVPASAQVQRGVCVAPFLLCVEGGRADLCVLYYVCSSVSLCLCLCRCGPRISGAWSSVVAYVLWCGLMLCVCALRVCVSVVRTCVLCCGSMCCVVVCLCTYMLQTCVSVVHTCVLCYGSVSCPCVFVYLCVVDLCVMLCTCFCVYVCVLVC